MTKNRIKKNTDSTQPIEAKVFEFSSGKEVGTVALPESIFNVPENMPVLHQVVVALQNNARQPLAHVKTKSEVSGGGKKPWKQKGTGHARQGSTRNPQWIGGGKAHGPRNNRNYTQKINKKMLALATKVALSDRTRESGMLLARGLKMDEIKTAVAVKLLKQLPLADRKTLVLVSEADQVLVKSLRNISRTTVKRAVDVNVRDILGAERILLAEEALPQLVTRFSNK